MPDADHDDVDDRLRVAMVVEQCWHRVPGGTARAAVDLARAVARRDDVTVTGVAARHGSPPAPEYAPPIEVRHLPLPRALLYAAWTRRFGPRVERATGPVDVIHATGLVCPPPGPTPLVLTLHDLAWRREPAGFTSRGIHLFEAALERARTDVRLVLCSSDATRADAADAGIPEDRLRTVLLGVEVEPSDDAAVSAARRTYRLDRPYVLCVGTLEPRKGHATLLQAMGQVDGDVDLVLVGPDGWGDDLSVAAAPLAGRVHLMGFVPAADLAALYRGAAVVAYPSRWEGFGFPVAEAMAHGAPVVTSAGTATEEVAGGAALLVQPGDPEALADALTRVLVDDALAADLRRRGLDRAATLTWDATAAATVAAYREAREVAA